MRSISHILTVIVANYLVIYLVIKFGGWIFDVNGPAPKRISQELALTLLPAVFNTVFALVATSILALFFRSQSARFWIFQVAYVTQVLILGGLEAWRQNSGLDQVLFITMSFLGVWYLLTKFVFKSLTSK